MEYSNMKKAIVITSIFPPTEAVKDFSTKTDYQLYVVGDKKTPLTWNCNNAKYISLKEQEEMNLELAKVLPYNHYCRKMLGYLTAMYDKANFIVDTDDDNIPKKNWDFPDFENAYDTIDDDMGFVNVYQLYTKQKIWPRGLPLRLVNKQFDLENKLSKKKSQVGIWQGLADEDPDVDAIYRLTNDIPCNFSERKPIVLGKGTISPYNTQNTIIRKELYSLLYLPTYVTFRFTDILRGLVAQPIMWLYDFQLGFTNATVVQKRNPHDYMKDFFSELPMYQHCEKVIEIVSDSISASKSIDANLFDAYKNLLNANVVCNKELETLEAWLKDLQKVN